MKRVSLVLVLMLVFAACSDDSEGATAGTGEGVSQSDGTSDPDNPSSGSGSDGTGASDGSGSSGGENPANAGSSGTNGSEDLELGEGDWPADPRDYFPTDQRCQIEGNQTIGVPAGGFLVSVDVIDVESGQVVMSLDSEMSDEINDLVTENDELWDRVLSTVDQLNSSDTGSQLAGVWNVGAEPVFRSPQYYEYLTELYETKDNWDSFYQWADYELQPMPPQEQIDELVSKDLEGSLTDSDTVEIENLVQNARFHLLPLVLAMETFESEIADEIQKQWKEALSTHDMVNLAFICGYLYPMERWNGMVSHWGSLDSFALDSFIETVNRVHAGGDLLSSLTESMRDQTASVEEVARTSTIIATKPHWVQAFGVLMLGAGSQQEDGFPAIYLTVKDGGSQMAIAMNAFLDELDAG